MLSGLDIFRRQGKEEERLLRVRALIEKSGHFDEEYYLSTYPDVADSGIDPIIHYLKLGAQERRNPSPRFNTRRYLAKNPDVRFHSPRINPLVHYIRFGIKEGREA